MPKQSEDGRIQCRVKITGTYRGSPWEFIDPEDSDGSQFIDADGDPSSFWWTEGNFGCDCNRAKFLPEAWGVEDDCGTLIKMDKIEPIDKELAQYTLELNETL